MSGNSHLHILSSVESLGSEPAAGPALAAVASVVGSRLRGVGRAWIVLLGDDACKVFTGDGSVEEGRTASFISNEELLSAASSKNSKCVIASEKRSKGSNV